MNTDTVKPDTLRELADVAWTLEELDHLRQAYLRKRALLLHVAFADPEVNKTQAALTARLSVGRVYQVLSTHSTITAPATLLDEAVPGPRYVDLPAENSEPVREAGWLAFPALEGAERDQDWVTQ